MTIFIYNPNLLLKIQQGTRPVSSEWEKQEKYSDGTFGR